MLNLKTSMLYSLLTVCFVNAYSQKEYEMDSINSSSPDKEIIIIEKDILKSETKAYDKKEIRNGAYFGTSLGYGKVNNADAFHASISLMSYLNHYLGLGIKGKIVFTEHINLSGEKLKETIAYAMGYVGINFEPVIFNSKSVHLALPLFFGAGSFAYTHIGYKKDNKYPYTAMFDNEFSESPSTAMAVFEPGLDAEYKAFQWLRIGIGASYRILKHIDDDANPFVGSSNGFSYNLTFKIGLF